MTEETLPSLLSDIRQCSICQNELPAGPRPVLQASSTARIQVCGQAPGRRVHETGIPFNDPSGDRLREWMGIDRDIFYDQEKIAIIPMGFCFPGTSPKGGDLPPRPECAANWHDKLFARLPKPVIRLVIGQYAQNYHLKGPKPKTLTDIVRNWHDYGPINIPLPHPSPRNNIWLKKNSWFEEEVVPHIQQKISQVL